MPRVKKVVEPVIESKCIEPVTDLEFTESEQMPSEPPKLRRSRAKKDKTPEKVVVAPVVVPVAEVTSGKKENLWVAHVQKVRAANEGMSYKDAMKLAKDSYNK